MQLRDWLQQSGMPINAFAKTVKIERAMIYRYFTGSVPRAKVIQRIEALTSGAVTAQDFHINATTAGQNPPQA